MATRPDQPNVRFDDRDAYDSALREPIRTAELPPHVEDLGFYGNLLAELTLGGTYRPPR